MSTTRYGLLPVWAPTSALYPYDETDTAEFERLISEGFDVWIFQEPTTCHEDVRNFDSFESLQGMIAGLGKRLVRWDDPEAVRFALSNVQSEAKKFVNNPFDVIDDFIIA